MSMYVMTSPCVHHAPPPLNLLLTCCLVSGTHKQSARPASYANQVKSQVKSAPHANQVIGLT